MSTSCPDSAGTLLTGRTSTTSVPAEAVHYEVESDYKAIAEHYLPTQAGGELPASNIGAFVSIADKLEARHPHIFAGAARCLGGRWNTWAGGRRGAPARTSPRW